MSTFTSRSITILLILALITSVGLSLLVNSRVSADPLPVVYVNAATGDDSYDGSSPLPTPGTVGPKKTIAAGIDVVATDGTVYVAAGTYDEYHLHLNNNMNLVGAGALSTIIDGGRRGYVLQISSAPFQRNTISGFTIKNGSAGGSDPGGGVYVGQFHIVTINDCAIIGNYKGAGSGMRPGIGGGVCNDGGALYMNRCTVSGNTADHLGGGIANVTMTGFAGALTELTNCTISGNTITDYGCSGGGVYNSRDADARLVNVTIAYNRATHETSAGGGFTNWAYSSMYFKNCIVANNTAGNPYGQNGWSEVPDGVHSEGHNISGDDSCYFHESTDKINTDPLLGPLQNNGGPTATHDITMSSPAFNAGTADGAPPTDQRGVARPQAGLFDIGAFELQVAAPVVTAVSPDHGARGESLTVVITGANLTGTTGVNFGAGITVTGFTVDSAGQITAMINIATDAEAGPRTVSVTALGMTASLANSFTVTTLQNQFVGSGSYSSSIPTSFNNAPTVINPTVAVQSASLSSLHPPAGGTVTVNALVGNTSAVDGTTYINLYINGKIEYRKGVAVASGKQVPVSFDVSRTEPGTYQVYVNSIPAGSFTVEAFNNNDIVLYLSIACILSALILGYFYLRRYRGY